MNVVDHFLAMEAQSETDGDQFGIVKMIDRCVLVERLPVDVPERPRQTVEPVLCLGHCSKPNRLNCSIVGAGRQQGDMVSGGRKRFAFFVEDPNVERRMYRCEDADPGIGTRRGTVGSADGLMGRIAKPVLRRRFIQ